MRAMDFAGSRNTYHHNKLTTLDGEIDPRNACTSAFMTRYTFRHPSQTIRGSFSPSPDGTGAHAWRPSPSHQIGQRNAMTGSYRHCGSSKKPPHRVHGAPCTPLLPVAESGGVLPAFTATRASIPTTTWVPFLGALRQKFYVRPVGNAHHTTGTRWVFSAFQLPDTPLA